MQIYGLADVSKSKMCSLIRSKIELNAEVKDFKIINLLVHKGEQDLREAMEGWFSPCHVNDYFYTPDVAVPKFPKSANPKDKFLEDFYAGRFFFHFGE